MAVTISSFGKYPDGREISLYTMENGNGMRVSVANIGAALVRVEVPDREGRLADVVLGFDRAEDYLENGCFFGVVIGPSANRIGNASFDLDGATYPLKANDGANKRAGLAQSFLGGRRGRRQRHLPPGGRAGQHGLPRDEAGGGHLFPE